MAVVAPHSQRRVRELSTDDERTWLTVGGEAVELRCTPDPVAGRTVLGTTRHASWVVLDVVDDQVRSAMFGSSGRVPRVDPVSCGVALHLAASGVPTYLRRRS